MFADEDIFAMVKRLTTDVKYDLCNANVPFSLTTLT